MTKTEKQIRQRRRRYRFLSELTKGLQKIQWGAIQVDTDVLLVGKPEMILMVKEMIDESLRQEATIPSQASSLELGASTTNDNQAPHAEAPLSEETAQKGQDQDEQTKQVPFARYSEKT